MTDEIVRLTPDDRAKLKAAVEQGVASSYRTQAERDFISELAKEVKDKIGINPKLFKKLVKLSYKSNADQLNKETEDLLDLAESIGVYSSSEE